MDNREVDYAAVVVNISMDFLSFFSTEVQATDFSEPLFKPTW